MSELGLREALNVADLIARDALVQRILLIRTEAIETRRSIQRWNRSHPDEAPLSTTFEDAVIAWCAGDGPPPTEVLP